MGFMELIGQLAGSLQKPKSETATKYGIPPQMQPLYGAAAGVAQTGLEGGFEPYPGDLAAGPSSLQEMGFAKAGDLFPGLAGGLERTAAGEFLSPESNPYLERYAKAATDPLMEQWQEGILPEIRSSAQKAGMFASTPRAAWESRTAGDLMRRMGDVRANIYSGAYGRERELMQGAPGQVSNLLQSMVLGPGATQRGITQQDLSAKLAEWLRIQPQEAMQLAVSLLGGTPVAPAGKTTTGGIDIGGAITAGGTILQDVLKKGGG